MLTEAFDMEFLEITDYAVYDAQPQTILDARRAIRIEREKIRQRELDDMKGGHR